MSTALARKGGAPGRHVYDAIVVGGDLAAALAAALLAKRGLQVLFVQHEAPGLGYEHEGWFYPWLPLVAPPLKALPALEEALAEIGAATEVSRLFRTPTPPLQVLRERERFDLFLEPEARVRELSRALGDADGKKLVARLDGAAAAAAATDAFLNAKPDLSVQGLFARWKLKRLLARTPELATASPLDAAEPRERLWLALGRQCASMASPSTLSAARVAGKLASGLCLYPGGRAAFRELLANRARELGADVLSEGEAVGEFAFEGSKPVGIRLARGETTYRTGAIVSTLDLQGLTRLVPAERAKPLGKLGARLQPTHALFCVSAVVPEPALPRGLGELALIEPRDPEFDLVRLHVDGARRFGATEDAAGERLVTAVVTVPLALRLGGPMVATALAERVWGELEAVLPFTRRHVVDQAVHWLDAPQVAAKECELHSLYGLAPDSAAGVVGFPIVGPWARFFVAGRPALPGLGLEGEALSAHLAARRVELLLNKNDPLKARRPGA